MAHPSSHMKNSGRSRNRGTRRTRGGAGRHNLGRAELRGPNGRIRVCLGCNRPFKSRGPWNRICGRCRERNLEVEDPLTYRVPKELRGTLLSDFDDF